jgi:hypothetical protein
MMRGMSNEESGSTTFIPMGGDRRWELATRAYRLSNEFDIRGVLRIDGEHGDGVGSSLQSITVSHGKKHQ